MSGTLSVNPPSRSVACYKSRNKISGSKSTNCSQALILPVSGTTKRTQTCRFCRKSGHDVRLKCQKIIDWGCEFIALNKDKSHQERLQFVLELWAADSPYKIEESPKKLYTLSVINNIDDKTRDLIVHKLYCSTGAHHLVIQCTILKELDIPCEVNQNIHVNIHAVDKYVQKGTTTLIINKLVRNSFVEGILQNSLPQMPLALIDVSNNAKVLYSTNRNLSDFVDI